MVSFVPFWEQDVSVKTKPHIAEMTKKLLGQVTQAGKLVARSVLIFVAAGISITLVANYFIRVAADGRSWGIIEEIIWGRSLIDSFTPNQSENFKKWDAAAKASERVETLLRTHGISRLTESADLNQQRAQAWEASKSAYTNAIAIPRDYLQSSNQDLAAAYFIHFVPAMDAVHQGLMAQDSKLVRKGVSDYNKFIEWMQSRKSSDFKELK